MKAALLALLLAGCAVTPSPPQPRCPPLPELPASPTATQQANHYAVVIRLYAQCAGATGE